MKTLLLTRSDIVSILTMEEAIDAVENAFKMKSAAESSVKAWLFYKEHGGDLACWSTYMRDIGASGMKAIGYNTNNPRRGLPTITAVIILHDPETSFPISILDGTSLTAMRTGAAGAVAAKHLARRDSEVIGMIGAGVQARTQLMGLNEIFEIEKVRVYDVSMDAGRKFSAEMEKLDLSVEVCTDAEAAVLGSDIVVTATPSREPIVMDGWVSPGLHINAMGADEPGKVELDPLILTRAKIVVDDLEDTVRRGEINVAISKGIIKAEDIYADLEEIVTGKRPGRESNREITVFDGAGVAIEDVAVAWEAYKKAEKEGAGDYINLI